MGVSQLLPLGQAFLQRMPFAMPFELGECVVTNQCRRGFVRQDFDRYRHSDSARQARPHTTHCSMISERCPPVLKRAAME